MTTLKRLFSVTSFFQGSLSAKEDTLYSILDSDVFDTRTIILLLTRQSQPHCSSIFFKDSIKAVNARQLTMNIALTEPHIPIGLSWADIVAC